MAKKISREELLTRLGENIAAIRKIKNLSLRQVAERCNIDFSDIGKIEKGKKNISVLTLVDLASGLGVKPGKLMEFQID